MSLSAQKIGLSANFGEVAYYGTIDSELQYAVAQNWTLSAGGSYNPWSFDDLGVDGEVHHRRRDFAVGTRWWPWHVYSGWWVSAEGMIQEYNEAHDLFSKGDYANEGVRFGARLGAGYTYMLSSWLNFDFGLRMYGGWTDYVTYACPVCGRKVDEGFKKFFLPDEIVFALMFVF